MIPLSTSGSLPYILPALLLVPLLGIGILFFLPERLRKAVNSVAIGAGILNIFLALQLVGSFNLSDTSFQFPIRASLIDSLGVSFSLGVDGIAVWMILFTNLLMGLALIRAQGHGRAYYMLLLLLQESVLGTFMALDLVLYYLFWELMLIPNFFLLYRWGTGDRERSAFKFAIYTAIGSLLMLVSIAAIGNAVAAERGGLSFYLGDLIGLSPGMQMEDFILFGFLAAFFLKSAVFPFHTWLPDAHRAAPEGASFDLTLVLPKMGLFGAIRFLLLLSPDALFRNQILLISLGVGALLYGALLAWKQTDLKRFLAYSTVSHIGLSLAALASLKEEGLKGCVFLMIGSGISTGGLLILVSELERRIGVKSVSELGGLAGSMPRFAFLVLLFGLSSIGLPLTNGFIGEFFSIAGTFDRNVILGLLASLGIVFGAVYLLSIYRRVFFGDTKISAVDLGRTELVTLLPLVVLIFLLGLYPRPVLAGVEHTISVVDSIQGGDDLEGAPNE